MVEMSKISGHPDNVMKTNSLDSGSTSIQADVPSQQKQGVKGSVRTTEDESAILDHDAAEVAQIQADFQKKLDEISKALETMPINRGEILNRIIRLLVEMLSVLQGLGAAQAAQLSLPTKMQALYTNIIASAPVYTKDGAHGTIKEEDDTKREGRIAAISGYVDTLRNYRDVWADLAKKQQSQINTTNEAVNQQVDMCTTWLRQLSELVSLLTR
jgi:hypothetical protein